MNIELSLLPHQEKFVTDTETRFLGLVAGYGSGKTYAFCMKGLYLAYLNAGFDGMLLEPTNSMAADILVPTFTDILTEYRVPHEYKAAPYPTFKIAFEQGISTIYIRSAENFKRLTGFNLAWFGVDEADTITKRLAWHMWRVLQSRLRAKAPYVQGFTTSTPEGFNFLYEYFVKEPEERAAENRPITNRKILHASTYDNIDNLEPGYIQSLLEEYPDNLIQSYLNGQFVNLTTGNVYKSFNRKDNHTPLTIEDFDNKKTNELAPLHIGVDFNIDKTCGIVHVIKGDIVYAVDEIVKQRDTEQLIESIKKRYPGRSITIYPDASGQSRNTNATFTDIQLLKKGGFFVRVSNKNPQVRDRINAMNAKFKNGAGEVTYYVNTTTCPTYTRALETQGYNDNGEPDKAHDQDHPVDASGYFIYDKFPITAKRKQINIIGV
jgi:phage terminase large subunit